MSVKNEKRAVYIYSIIDPIDHSVRYVGKTINPLKRLNTHYYRGKKIWKQKLSDFDEWMTGLKMLGYKPYMFILEVTTFHKWEERERYWIAEYLKTSRLFNKHEGGRYNKGCVKQNILSL